MALTITKTAPAGTSISRWQHAEYTVVSTEEILGIYIWVILGEREFLAYAGDRFTTAFADNSSVTVNIASYDYEFSIVPNAGWQAGMSVVVEAPTSTLVIDPFDNTKSIYSGGTIHGEFIDCGNVLQYETTDAWSVSLWVKMVDTSWYSYLLGNKNQLGSLTGWTIQVGWSGDALFPNRPALVLINADTTVIARAANFAINDFSWHHIVTTYNGNDDVSGMQVYVDGTLPGQTTVANDAVPTIVNADNRMQLFNHRHDLTSNNSRLNHIAIWPGKILTLAEVQEIYAKVLPATTTPGDLRETSVGGDIGHYWWMGGVGDYEPIIHDRVGDAHGAMVGLGAANIIGDIP